MRLALALSLALAASTARAEIALNDRASVEAAVRSVLVSLTLCGEYRLNRARLKEVETAYAASGGKVEMFIAYSNDIQAGAEALRRVFALPATPQAAKDDLNTFFDMFRKDQCSVAVRLFGENGLFIRNFIVPK